MPNCPAKRPLRAAMAKCLRLAGMRDVVGFEVSLMLHCVLLLLLAMFVLRSETPKSVLVLQVGTETETGDLLETHRQLEASRFAAESMRTPAETGPSEPQLLDQLPVAVPFSQPPGGAAQSRPSEQVEAVPREQLLLVSEAPTGGGLEGRSPQRRAQLARNRGGTPESERAVELGLAWLADHQRQDGSWRLDHRGGPCQGRCANPGQSVETSIGATGLALLPFLGAGYTHDQGKYRDVVSAGLDFLQANMKGTPHGGDLHWDTTVGMYAQGIATLALSEAFAMSGDQSLETLAQDAIDFICTAQHARGGWRYLPGQPGDTTVTGWQVMALKSGRLARLYVPNPTTEKASRFLNTVQDGGGAFYGYVDPEKAAGPTAVGLLLRMYLGWSRQDERLQRGVAYLSSHGPSETDMYFNFYATQVLHHFEGNHWGPWNERMREFLVAEQSDDGHQRGSWFFVDRHGSVGGRHYTTAICTMILEVYYRYMPLYGQRAVEEGF